MSSDLKADLESLRIARDEPNTATTNPGGGKRALRVVFWLSGLGLVAGLVAFAYPYAEAALFKTEVTFGEVSTLSPVQASTSLTATGYVVPQVISRVASKVVGRIAAVHVREGDHVEVGQVIIELDGVDQQAAIAASQARAAAAQARAAAAQSRVDTARANVVEIGGQIARQRALLSSGAASRQTVEDLEARKQALDALIVAAQSDLRAAQADVRAAQADVATQRVLGNQLQIRAPIAGAVITKPPEVGETVDPVRPMLEIADMGSLFVEVDVPEGRLSLVRVGSPTEIVLDAFSGRRFRGMTAEIGHRVNRAKATLVVKVRFVDDNAGVVPDMSARVSFLSEALTAEQMRAQEKTVVPSAAVVSRGGERVVFVVDNEVVRMRSVRLGARLGDDYELLEGPDVGAKIVIDPPSTLADGRKVKERSGS